MEISESIEESQTGIIDTNPAAGKDVTLLRGITEDGQVTVQIIATKPMKNTPMEINISFLDINSSLISNVHYAIEVTQMDVKVMSEFSSYSEKGLVTLSAIPLQTSEPVNIQITVHGIGLPKNKNNWIDTKGQVLMFNVVPEFGATVLIIFVIAILSVIVVSAKSNFLAIPRF